MINGVVAAELMILILSTLTSISPVASFGFLSLRSTTTPVASTIYSLRIELQSSDKASPQTNCVIPSLSLKSINSNAPKLRRFATQPIRVTVIPTSLNLYSLL